MTSFEFNKVAGAVLMTGLIALAAGQAARILYHPKPLEKSVLAIDVGATASPGETAKDAAPAVPLPQLLASADATAGQSAAKKCTACHTFEKGGANKIGPNLYGIVTRMAGTVPGFSYSAAVSGAGQPWTYERIFEFMADPKAFLPGNKMAFAGVKKAEERANVLAFLRTLSDSPVAFPTP